MLISALYDYYSILEKEEKVLPDGYSRVKIDYIISLTPEGMIDDIIDCRKVEDVIVGKKIKTMKFSQDMIMPKRSEKSSIDANIIDHRPLYIFGLSFDGELFTPVDRTNKAKLSHEDFCKKNTEIIEGIDSDLVNAFRNFISRWNPERETENIYLKRIEKDYSKSGYAFCLSGYPTRLLHLDRELKSRWEHHLKEKELKKDDSEYKAQCAVLGTEKKIARIHNKIKGVKGGLPTGSVLIGFNNPSENSYGNVKSYNSNISEDVMIKYTEALNYLLGSGNHKVLLDETTVVFWAMDTGDEYGDLFKLLMYGSQDDGLDAKNTEDMLKSVVNDAKGFHISPDRLKLKGVNPNVDFYMLGLKSNSSRISVKFIFKRKYADILGNIATFQKDIQMSEDIHLISLRQIEKEMVSPKSTNEKVNPALIANIFESVTKGVELPQAMLSTMVKRVKTDIKTDKKTDPKSNAIRVGVIRACINRKAKKEVIKVGLDINNRDKAYLCGRLFAVLEKLQNSASNYSLNRTIKDSYFSSAASRPALVFPKILMLAQNHLNKSKFKGYYNKQIAEIIEMMEDSFPETLSLIDQGKFIIGYYQQLNYKENNKEDK